MKKKVTLTISGGGSRSAAGLGVIKYLEENNYEIIAISGTSGGAFISIMYSHGVDLRTLESVLTSFKAKELFRPSFKSLFSLSGIEKDIKASLVGKKQKIPFYTCSTNIVTAQADYVSEGNMMHNSMASASLYPFFTPLEINGELHADGGYTDNLPNLPLIEKFNVPNISVNVSNPHDKVNKKKLAKRLIRIQNNFAAKPSFERTDLLINVTSVAEINMFDLSKIPFCIEEGYKLIKTMEAELENL